MTPRRTRPSSIRPAPARSKAQVARALPAGVARSLVANNRDGLLVISNDGAVAFANQSANALVGLDGASLIGRKFEEIVPSTLHGAWQTARSSTPGVFDAAVPPTFRIPLAGGKERIVEAVMDDRSDDAAIRGIVVH